MSRGRRIVNIVVRTVILLVALAIIGYLILPVFMDYLPEPFKKVAEESYQAQLNRMKVFEDIVKRHEYEKCGEYVLKPGLNSIDIYGVVDRPMKCYYIFRRPEPGEEYIVYLPWGELMMAYVRDEDRGKTIYYSFNVFGSLQMPHIWANPARLTPFYGKCREWDGCAIMDVNIASGYRKSFKKDGYHFTAYYELVSQDGLMALTIKPESDGMPVRFWVAFHAIVYRRGEEKPILPPIEEHSVEELRKIADKWFESVSWSSPYGDGDLFESPGRVVVEYVESLGYRYCGTYRVDGGLELNITHVVEDPYEGEACYIIVESDKPLTWRYSFQIYPVWSKNMSRTAIRNSRIYYDLELFVPFRNMMFNIFSGTPPQPAYSRRSAVMDVWGSEESLVEEWQDPYFRKALILFYFKAESPEREDVKVVVDIDASFKQVEPEPLWGDG